MIFRGAIISDDGLYRYTLTRELYERHEVIIRRTVSFIGLNPSTADALVDDPTIRRCANFARKFGAHRLVMANLYAYRATNPKTLLEVEDPIGPMNVHYLKSVIEYSDIIICAWGTRAHLTYAHNIWKLIPEPFCLGLTKDGHPRHPLYLPNTASLIPYKMEVS